MLPVERVAELLGLIAEEKKISFDREYAERLYLSYNASRHQNDDPTIQKLTEEIHGKKVLLIAPGRRLTEGKETIESLLKKPDVVSISLNNYDLFDTDYVITTRVDAFQKARKDGKRLIATSGVCDSDEEDALWSSTAWAMVSISSGLNHCRSSVSSRTMRPETRWCRSRPSTTPVSW